MSDATAEFNPYQAPAADSEVEPGLEPGTEFLVSDKVVLCADSVTLPRVCVQSGSREDLVTQHRSLYWIPRGPLFVGVIVLLVTGPFSARIAFTIIDGGFWRFPMGTSVLLFVPPLILIWLTLFGLAYRGMRRVDATWSINRELQRRNERHRRAFAIAAALFGTAFIASIVVGSFFNESLFMLSFWTGLGALIGMRMASRRGPYLAGLHNRLNVLLGISPAFLQVVNDMIASAASRES